MGMITILAVIRFIQAEKRRKRKEGVGWGEEREEWGVVGTDDVA